MPAGDRAMQAQLARLKLQKRFEDIVEPADAPARTVQGFLAESFVVAMDDATCKRYAATNCLFDAGLIYLQSALRLQLAQGGSSVRNAGSTY
jgi:hypothetical protein